MLTSMSSMMNQGGGPRVDPQELQKKIFESMDGMKTKIDEINK